MAEPKLKSNSLVLYKNRPARVLSVGDKIEIEALDFDGSGSSRVSVRPKDVELLHPGPLDSLSRLTGAPKGEIETAWELLVGQEATLAELAELAYGEYSPRTAWAAWEYLEDGLLFTGTPDALVGRSRQEVLDERVARESRQEEQEAWASFLENVQKGSYAPGDERFLAEVEALALGQRDDSRVMQELGKSETPQNAHDFLLKLGYWDYSVNPYPARAGLPTNPPDGVLPELPEEERRDFTDMPAYAIDDEGNQEPDDAISLDGERIWVHIADVAALVDPDSPIDLEARARGENLYLPEGMVPILPPEAVNRLGLGLQEVSPALSFGLRLTTDGEIEEITILASWVRVTRLSYEQADQRLEELPDLAELYRLSQVYQGRRRANGAVFFDLPETRIRIHDGRVEIKPILSLRSRDLVREFMLMTGEAAARYAVQHEIPFPYSIQEGVDRSALPENLSKLEFGPDEMAEMYALRRYLKPSQVSTLPGQHAGIGLPVYARATSPLRRYLDLVVHQQIRAHLAGRQVLEEQEILARVGAAEAVVGSVVRTERKAERHWTLVYLLQHPRWRGEGILVDQYRSTARMIIPELAIEARLHLRQELPLNSRVDLTTRGANLPELDGYFRIAR